MIIASIDIGTNTILLLIAEIDTTAGRLTAIENQYEMPRIGRGLKAGEPIAQDRIDAMRRVLDSYKRRIDYHNCGKVLLTATNAMRIASNGNEIVEMINKNYGWDVDIVTGDEEARISFLGASSAIEGSGYKTVIDIGGGSTEVIYGNDDELSYKNSFRIGAVALTERFFKSDPPSEENITDAKEYLTKLFNELTVHIPQDSQAIAVAGTPTSLSSMAQRLKEYVEEKVEASKLSAAKLNELFNSLAAKPSVDILEHYGAVVKGREDVITGGSLILLTLMDVMRLQEVRVSGKGIRYGAVIDYMLKSKR